MIPSSRIKIATAIAAVTASATLLFSACSKKDDSASSSPLTISGGFSGVSLMSIEGSGVDTFAATDYTVICSMMVDPFTSGNSVLNSSGEFSVTIAGASGQPIGCMIVKSGKRVADFEFTAAEAGMTGATGGTGLAVNSGATAIQLPSNLSLSGAVVAVPVANITQNSSTPPTVSWADPTGTWSITGACQTELNSSGSPVTSCVGAQSADDMPTSVYLKQLEATNGSATKRGLAVWKDATARQNCGNKEGVTLDAGWTATGGWAGAMTGGVSMDISSDGNRATLSAKAKVRTHDNGGSMTAVCGKTTKTGGAAIVSGTTLCSEVDWTGGGWGMNAKACELYCITGALSSGGSNPDFDWGAATCKKRYKVRWENSNELSTDKNYGQGSVVAGAFSNGTCSDTSFDGCKSGSTILFEADRAEDQYMIGELFISGNVGTLMQKQHFSSTFQNATRNGTISCGGTHIEKMTMTQTGASSASVTVEHSFVADSNNSSQCASNVDFARNSSEEKSMILKLVKN